MKALPPYAKRLGIERVPGSAGLLRLGPSSELEGRRDFIHGGVITALLEMACYEALGIELEDEQPVSFKPINVSVDFVRGGRMTETFAIARIIRVGGRVANVTAETWQAERSKPIATARMHMLLNRG